MSDSGPIVGIDLGTTNSLIAVCDARGPRTLGGASDAGDMVPSVVRFEPDGSSVVGHDARARAVEFPRTTVASIKRLMGRSLGEVADDAAALSYPVVEGEHNTARVRLELDGGERIVSPQEVSALILGELKRVGESDLNQPVRRAVVTVPAYFDDAQRQATKDAGRLAGLDVVRMVSEPTAAALAYGIGASAPERPETIAVFDLGGGTFDISILRVLPAPEGSPDASIFQVLASAGDSRLGGDDVDLAIVRLFVREIMGVDTGGEDEHFERMSSRTKRALLQFAEGMKIRLSESEQASAKIEVEGRDTYERTLTRDELESLISPLLDRIERECARALRLAEKSAGDAVVPTSLVLVGGATRMPAVRRVAGGAFGVEPYTALDPDRVVALGAARHAWDIQRERDGDGSDAMLLDVIPLSLGIETAGGAVAKLVMANSTLPAKAIERFSTQVDGQVSVKLHVLQGEREMASDCRSLGEFHLSGLPPMPAGVPQLEVEFTVDLNGVLSVRAHERRSGKRAETQLVPNHGLSRDEVDRMEAESLDFAREDMTRHRITDLCANAKLDLKWIGERLERYRDKLDDGYADALAEKLGVVRGFVERAEADWSSVEADAFASAKQDLDESSVRLQEVGIAESLKGQDHD